ncbi:NAD(P)-dependent oxidoreductase [Carnobacterium funditum]|uniref:NAD(P)-dependent oxidoreductase n=1 Tax=Carnobacterium funditum TaxID=2752 RepID=UPI0005541BA7|nr:NAD(P)H-binding protein [Carnobacterium funditum]
MRIGIIGATGKSGSCITAEALDRSHLVVPLVRNARKLEEQDWEVVEKDLFDLAYTDIDGLDVVVDAFKSAQGREELHQKSIEHLISVLKGHKKPRLIVVGGSGSLIVDRETGMHLSETEDFPSISKPTAYNMEKALETLEDTTDVNWTYISPSKFFVPKGTRTGGYQLGTDFLLTNHLGQSEISYADYAIAVVDEIENRAFEGRRITVCSK